MLFLWDLAGAAVDPSAQSSVTNMATATATATAVRLCWQSRHEIRILILPKGFYCYSIH